MSIQRILVAVDGERLSLRALDTGVELARALGAELGLIHVLDIGAIDFPDRRAAGSEPTVTSHEAGRRLLASLRQRSSLPSPQEFLPIGRPASEIVKAAREWPADLIVIGSRGRSWVQRAMLGSVAEEVMRHAPCQVLVVRFPHSGA